MQLNPKNKKKINPVISSLSLLFIFMFVLLSIRISFVSLSPKIEGIDLKVFAKKRNTATVTIHSNRGTIYDHEGNALAMDTDSFTVVAILSPDATTDMSKPRHVVDKEKTAKELANLINMKESTILDLLKKDLYQIELGPGGRGLTQIQMNAIKKLNLPGITFTITPKRYYPFGRFASYELGFAKSNGDLIVGELGLESYFNDYLTGVNGYVQYEKDLHGFKIPNTPEKKVNPKSGYDIHTTIDKSIQVFVENALSDSVKNYEPESLIMVVADAKTGQILASSSRPSFNPNIRDITSWVNPIAEETFEPGSTMKIYTYAAAIDLGLYNGDEKFKSGSYDVLGDVIRDWNVKGFGDITYNQGFYASSNVGVANLVESKIQKEQLKNYFEKFGFGKPTGITLPREKKGDIRFNYPIEVVTAGFGQGITTTALQHVQALTAIANDGKLVHPYLVESVIDPTTKKVYYTHKKGNDEQIIQPSTAKQIRELMYGVLNDEMGTGHAYQAEEYNLIGKTGTAQIADPVTGGYQRGDNAYIYSFAGMFPKDDPQIIIYAASKKPKTGYKKSVSDPVHTVVEQIGKYLDVNHSSKDQDGTSSDEIVMPSLLNGNLDAAKKILSKNHIVVLGNGNKVVKQFPYEGTKVFTNETIYLLTNGEQVVPDLTGYSKRDLLLLTELLGIRFKMEGFGFVEEQDIEVGTVITNKIKEIKVKLKPYDLKPKEMKKEE